MKLVKKYLNLNARSDKLDINGSSNPLADFAAKWQQATDRGETSDPMEETRQRILDRLNNNTFYWIDTDGSIKQDYLTDNAAVEDYRRKSGNATPLNWEFNLIAPAKFGLGAIGNGIRTGLQAMNTAFTPSTWLNPVTGAKLLSPTVGTIADAGIQGAFAYKGLNGLWNQGSQGTLLSDPASTFMHGLEVLPLVDLGSKAIGSAYRNIANSNIVKNRGFALPINNTLYWVGKGLGSEISLAPGTEGYMRVSDVLSKSPGTGRKLYDAAIKYAQNNGYRGIESGNMLLSAPKTYRIWEHYPNRQLLGNYGMHNNFNMASYGELDNVGSVEDMVANTANGIPTKFEEAPVYGLTEPSVETVARAKRAYGTPKADIMPVEGSITTGDIPNITPENAASITPEQWTAAQDAAIAKALNISPEAAASLTKQQWNDAVAKGINTEEIQRLRDLYSKVRSGQEPITFGHATPNTFTIFDKKYFGSTTDDGYAGRGFYFSTTRPATQEQINLGYPIGPHGEYPTMPGYGKNKMYVYVKGTPVFNKYGFPQEKDWFLEPELYGVNGKDFTKTAEIVVGNPKHIKLADAVTFDNDGVRIGLGDRDNFSNPDIRWGLLPWILGGGAAGYNYLNQDNTSSKYTNGGKLTKRKL